MPYNNMGSSKNITEKNFEEAGQTKAIGRGGILKAKKNMLELLKAELKKNELKKPKIQY